MKLKLNRIFQCVIIVSTLFSQASAAAMPPKSYTASYKINYKGVPIGESVHQLAHYANNAYSLEIKAHPYLPILPYHYVAKSDFRWQNGEIIPQHHRYDHKEGRKNKIGAVHFDWNKKQLKNQDLNPPWQADINDGMQDILSHTIKLRMDLMAGKGQPLHYSVVEEKKIVAYTFSIIALQELDTKMGSLKTLQLEHIDRKNRKTVLWLAEKYDYLPVKAEHYRKGKKVGGADIVAYQPESQAVSSLAAK